jgi:hypothetical protein
VLEGVTIVVIYATNTNTVGAFVTDGDQVAIVEGVEDGIGSDEIAIIHRLNLESRCSHSRTCATGVERDGSVPV